MAIHFYCPSCGEGLEGDDDLRGEEMDCPVCSRTINVPREGVDVAGVGELPRLKRPERQGPEGLGGVPGSVVWTVVVVGAVLFITLLVVSIQFQERISGDHGVECRQCEGSGGVTCSGCGGKANFTCTGCGGSGVRSNLRGESEACYECNESGFSGCSSCGGKGLVMCGECNGMGKIR